MTIQKKTFRKSTAFRRDVSREGCVVRGAERLGVHGLVLLELRTDSTGFQAPPLDSKDPTTERGAP